eukprot:360083-Chlamydomonas_euryale.AAC.1
MTRNTKSKHQTLTTHRTAPNTKSKHRTQTTRRTALNTKSKDQTLTTSRAALNKKGKPKTVHEPPPPHPQQHTETGSPPADNPAPIPKPYRPHFSPPFYSQSVNAGPLPPQQRLLPQSPHFHTSPRTHPYTHLQVPAPQRAAGRVDPEQSLKCGTPHNRFAEHAAARDRLVRKEPAEDVGVEGSSVNGTKVG